ncbi:MAG: tRNA (adenosine(37)-N6)-threonylcarbamoyltransferase complex transferase subunit TsaD [bacterium]|nr:tRNA (adenosine(37)-N6)-threonylcarbamoyltransferase complex transferase subunit TsaD [bacterium]
MVILGIESSCDETAAAVISEDGRKIRIHSNIIASQHEIHQKYGGIVPELASRRHMELILPIIEEALKQAGMKFEDLDGIAVTHTPGLVGSLLVGLQVAKSLAFSLKIPFIGVSHLEGHLYAPLLENPTLDYPYIGLLVSGGNTALYHVKKFGDYDFLGGTRDDAAGEAFDKVAKLLGLGYPGGPIIDKMAKGGNPKAIRFTKGKIKGHPFDFSFSGLKTAVQRYVNATGGDGSSPRDRSSRTQLEGMPVDRTRPRALVADLCASFQETVMEDLVEKTRLAAKKLKIRNSAVTGGVACNSSLRAKMPEAFFPSPLLCTDNAVMIAAVGLHLLKEGRRSPWNLNALANQDIRLNERGGV